MRAFVGVDIVDPGAIRAMSAAAARLGLRAAAQPHVTLAFLGEIGEERSAELASALDAVRFERFEITIAGLGAFPSRRRARVIWAGIRDGAGQMRSLARSVRGALGAEPGGGFCAHVTISRVKSGARLAEGALEREAPAAFGSQTVGSFSLKRSDGARGRRVHTALHTVGAAA